VAILLGIYLAEAIGYPIMIAIAVIAGLLMK